MGGTTLIDQFGAHQRYRGFSPATIRRRRGSLAMFARYLAPAPLPSATVVDLERFLAGRPSARTRHAYRSDLRMFYAWLTDRGVIDADPAAKLPRVKVPKSLPRPVAVNDALGALTWGARDTRRMVALALFAGLRCAEVANLQAEDVWLHGSPPVVVVRRGKGGKDRTIPLHPELAGLLADIPSSGPVFRRRNGSPATPLSVGRRVSAHLRRIGVDATAHRLRHTFGTELARHSGGDMILTAALMGHESMSTTMGYVRLTAGRAGDVVAGMFGGDAA